ncbi:MAG: succinylglutamate desuccinylase/aspartoacylase family protein [Shinella sp.]|uniref:succinylglutamate desuccinylase/aspartoacylase family protein n=1 Tax=Shinella sp. TaxID=1870904 RepID=UPI003C795446
MNVETISLTPGPMGGTRDLTVYRFGQPGARPRVYIQGGLHADEAPGMLVGFALRDHLARLEAEGAIHGEILLVPVANPIGLDQGVAGGSAGRFEATTGQNFNRDFPDAAQLALLQDDSPPQGDCVSTLRKRMLAGLDALAPMTQLAALQRALLRLAISADIVIDMHCDSEATTHLYCHSEQVDRAAGFGHAVNAGVVLHARLQGGASFDEACALPWSAFRDRWPGTAIPLACFAVTLEWRGMLDTDPATAENDAEAVVAWLAAQDVLSAKAATACERSVAVAPLAGVEVVTAPRSGLFLATALPGTQVIAGTVLGQLRCLPDGELHVLRASTDGLLYAREQTRIVRSGAELFFIAGQTPIRHGMLLST